MSNNKINSINQSIQKYFKQNPQVHKILAKELMPQFIKEGIFKKDYKNGLPIRKVLRDLDEKSLLNRIPFAFPKSKTHNSNWYFINKKVILSKIEIASKKIKKSSASKRINSDEHYVIDLCDMILNKKASRQHKFDFLLGDLHKDEKKRTRLPVDAYYQELNLVIEYAEKQHTEEVKHFDKPDKLTVSGVSRGEQRKIYDQKRQKLIPENGIDLISIDYSQLAHNSSKKLLLDKENDIGKIKVILDKYKEIK